MSNMLQECFTNVGGVGPKGHPLDKTNPGIVLIDLLSDMIFLYLCENNLKSKFSEEYNGLTLSWCPEIVLQNSR